MRIRHRGLSLGWLAVGLGCTLLPAGRAWAQDALADPAIRVGFHRGELFRTGTGRTRLEGYEVGADVPLQHSRGGEFGIFFSPTLTLGGTNRSGADEDGNIYRFLVNAKSRLGHSRAYAGLGAGYSFTQARVHEFRNVNGPASEFLLGYDFHAPPASRTKPFLEATYHVGAHSQMSGLSADLGIRF